MLGHYLEKRKGDFLFVVPGPVTSCVEQCIEGRISLSVMVEARPDDVGSVESSISLDFGLDGDPRFALLPSLWLGEVVVSSFVIEPLKVIQQLVEILGMHDADAGLPTRWRIAHGIFETFKSLCETHDATSSLANSMTALFQAVPW